MTGTQQSYQTLPQLDSPVLDATGRLTQPWYRVITSILQRTGMIATSQALAAAVPSLQNGVVLGQQAQGAGVPISAYSAATGRLIGVIPLGGVVGGTPQVQTVGASPFGFTAASDGTLVVFSSKVEVSRDGATYYTASLTGGSFRVLLGDRVRVTWVSLPPLITFFPG